MLGFGIKTKTFGICLLFLSFKLGNIRPFLQISLIFFQDAGLCNVL